MEYQSPCTRDACSGDVDDVGVDGPSVKPNVLAPPHGPKNSTTLRATLRTLDTGMKFGSGTCAVGFQLRIWS